MRAWEFLNENRSPPTKVITLRELNKMKISARNKEREEKERYTFMPLMYGDADRQREQLELEQLRAEIVATQNDTEKKSATAIHKNAESGIKSMKRSQEHITKLAKSGLGRELKP